ncbi:MAG: UPF0149 family protein [Acidobacteria bacterium]|nr:UPF0149 family protein [Acidobacteriota bacterium]
MPELIDNFTDTEAEKLSKFLCAPERPEGTMGYPAVAGFLFAVSYAPEVIMPSEWMPAIFDDQDPNYQNEAELREIVGAMLSLFNFVSCETDGGKVHLPPGCPVHAEPMGRRTRIETSLPFAHP